MAKSRAIKRAPTKKVAVGKSSLKKTIRDQSGAGKAKIGELLSKEGQITSNQLQEALGIQKKQGGKLSSILLKRGYIDDDTIVNVLSRSTNIPVIKISDITPDIEATKTLSYENAKKHMAFPVRFKGDGIVMCMTEPTDTDAVDTLQTELERSIIAVASTERQVVDAYKKFYKISDDEYQSFFKLVEEEEQNDMPVTAVDDFGALVTEAADEIELQSTMEDESDFDDFNAGDAPIIKLVNGILIRAINEGVSDIHIEPFEKSLQVRYRMDGSLFKAMNLPLNIKNALNSRLKILADLNIAERRVPQDGRIKMKMGKNKAVDFRVSTLPTLFGESIVMRILDKSALNVDLTKMGFEPETFETLKKCIFRPYGLLLVTGPTGSGKTTTLYSVLSVLNKEDTKILTAEDPVEFNFKGINQVLVREEVGMTFEAALKSFLRQDPDIIMVGEIRDMGTAGIAIKASMTGHLVFSTLHTNDCPSTIGRLLDIGIPSYMLATAVTMVLSQRLARRLCAACKVVDNSNDSEYLEEIGFSKEEIPDLEIYGPKGCGKCNGTGYKGRVGLYELMAVTDEVSKAINAAVPEDQLRKVAQAEGMATLREAGLEKVRQGVTSVQEVAKKTTVTKEALPAYLINPDRERYEDKDVIVREGNSDKDFFKLIQGAVAVVSDGKKISEITEPNVYFGEIAAITNEKRSASIISKGRSTVIRYPGDKLPELIDKYPDVSKHLFKTLAGRLVKANNIIVSLLNDRIRMSQQRR
ncbi:type IV-A pilus assembly ATPase PilB [Desulfococcaceae bacterium HSG7]|nr:type IV-A pilus assembly ATPase PilB [Desulfococcaceae bacterium HSG7]